MYQNKSDSPFKKDIILTDLLMYILKKWYIVLSVVLTAFIISIIYFKVILTPMYSSTARLYVVNKNAQNITSSDLSLSLYLSKDYAEIILDTPILSKVHDELNGIMSIDQIKSATTVQNIENTRILEIRALTPNPDTSKKIVDSICRISQEELIEIMGLDRIKIIKEGTISNTPSNLDYRKPLSIGILAAILLSLFIIFFMYSFDNKISTKEEIEKYLELNILGTIPYNPNKPNNK